MGRSWNAMESTMTDDETPEEKFHAWVRLEREILDTALAKRILEATIVNGPALDAFVTWILAGLGALVTLIITNVDKLAPIISMEGVITSISWAVLAISFGIFSRRNFQQARVRIDMGSDVSGGLVDLMTKYDGEKGPLMKQRAAQLGIAEPDQLDIRQAAEIVNDLLPRPVRLVFAWSMRKTVGAPHPQLVNEAAAVRFTFLQQCNYNAMVVVTSVAIVNLLCFLAKPRWFDAILSELF
jgi:hypothetical protein